MMSEIAADLPLTNPKGTVTDAQNDCHLCLSSQKKKNPEEIRIEMREKFKLAYL